jgi:hypothetical protein
MSLLHSHVDLLLKDLLEAFEENIRYVIVSKGAFTTT